MRLFAEVINFQVEEITLKGKTAEAVLNVTAFDADFPAQIYRVNIWGNFKPLQKQIIKGVVLELMFQKIKAANQYEPLAVLNVHAEDVRFEKDAKTVLRELHAQVKDLNSPLKD